MSIDYRKHTADYYILKTFLGAFAFIFSLFVAIAFVLILFEELDLFREYNIPFGLGLTYVFLRIPHELVKAAPMVVVLSMVTAIGNLIRHKEMLMLFIAGYTPIRLSAPLALLMAFLLLLLLWFNENISGPFSAKAQSLLETRIKGNTQGLSGSSGVWLYGEGNRIYRARTFFPVSNQIDGLSVFVYQGESHTLSEWIEAENAAWNPAIQQWNLQEVTVYKIRDDGSFRTEKHESLAYSLDRAPNDFGAMTQKIEQMSHRELSRLVDSIRKAGENPALYLPDLRIKEAFPFAVFFLGMMAYAMMIFFSSAGKASGVGLGLVAVILYFMTLSLGKSFAQAGAIPPWFGAWTPNLACLILTLYFFNRLRYEI